MHIVLVAPQIATNTGNIIRLAANTGVSLHLVEPLGFSMDDRRLRRAGLDYHEFADVRVHTTLPGLRAALPTSRYFATTSRATTRYDKVEFRADDVVMFGAEGPGLGPDVINSVRPENRLLIPMRPGNRSLNLANAVAVVVYEAWRQQGFPGGSAGTTAEALLPTDQRPA